LILDDAVVGTPAWQRVPNPLRGLGGDRAAAAPGTVPTCALLASLA
jgi:hypothetical protein